MTFLWSYFSLYKSWIVPLKGRNFKALPNISSLCEELTATYKPLNVSMHAHMFTALKLLSRDTNSKHPWDLAALPCSCWLYDSHCSCIWNSCNLLFCWSPHASEVGMHHKLTHGELWPEPKKSFGFWYFVVLKIILHRGSALQLSYWSFIYLFNFACPKSLSQVFLTVFHSYILWWDTFLMFLYPSCSGTMFYPWCFYFYFLFF